ncbi:DUF4238 domain-containing protein [Streptomyces sp. NPDC014773]|uniref:DUF4238 domain-containing protein n=1 Tax=Streptomyces sp. NPDC014773 TaxID=3364908 RepID=UPI003701D019
MGNNISRRHHVLPQTWLKAFAKDGKVLVRRRGTEQDLPQPVDKAFVVNRFYSNPAPGEESDGQEVETYLAQEVEGPAAESLNRTRAGQWPLPEAMEQNLRRLLAHQLVRSRGFRRLQQHIERTVKPMMTAVEMAPYLEEKLGRKVGPEDLQQLATALQEKPWAPLEDAMDPRRDLTHQLKAADGVQQKLSSWNLELLRAPNDRPLLLLADVGTVVRQADGSFSPLPPLLPDDGELLAPIAPHLLLVATPRKPTTDLRLTTKKAGAANRGATTLCDDAVVRRPGHRWPKGRRLDPHSPHLRPPAISWTTNSEPGKANASEARSLSDQSLADLVQRLSTCATNSSE